MKKCNMHLLQILATLCLAGAIFLAAGSEATSLTEKDALQNEESPDTISSFGYRGNSLAAGVETPAYTAEVETSAYIDRSGHAKAWSEIGEDAWPEHDFSGLLDVLPALYGIRDTFQLSDSKKQLSDSSFRESLPVPSGDSSLPLLGNVDWSNWKVRPTFALTAEEFRKVLQHPRPPRLVDLRRKEDFAQFRLAGSLNIPAFALQTKGFLTRRPFVLLDEGYDPQGMRALCEELRQAGLKASFLYGGLRAWKASGGELEGDRFAQYALNRMPVEAFRIGLTDEHRLIVTLDDSLPLNDFPQAVALPYRGDPQEWIEQLEKTLERWTERPELFSVVLVSRFGKESDRLEQTLRASRLSNIFVLEGGLQAYRDLLSRELVARERGTASTDAPAGCPNCRLGCQ